MLYTNLQYSITLQLCSCEHEDRSRRSCNAFASWNCALAVLMQINLHVAQYLLLCRVQLPNISNSYESGMKCSISIIDDYWYMAGLSSQISVILYSLRTSDWNGLFRANLIKHMCEISNGALQCAHYDYRFVFSLPCVMVHIESSMVRSYYDSVYSMCRTFYYS